jgi:ParB family chromosome partitioning protein
LPEFRFIEIKMIQPNKLNPRSEFNKKELDELSDSIKENGLLQPLVVRPKDDFFEVVVGERRYRASQQAGLEIIPALIHPYSDEEVIELNLIENIQRTDLNAVEKAKACKLLRERSFERYGTWDKIASRIGVNPETVKSWIRTLGLPEEIQKRIAPRGIQRVPEGKVDYQTALRIVDGIKEKPRQEEVIEKLATKQVPKKLAKEVIRRVAQEPSKPVMTVVKEVLSTPVEMQFRLAHVEPLLRGVKTQTARHLRPDELNKLKPGETFHASIFEPHFADLRVKSLTMKRLRELSEEDIKREGYENLGKFKEYYEEIYGKWNPNELVDIVQFELVKSYSNVDKKQDL